MQEVQMTYSTPSNSPQLIPPPTLPRIKNDHVFYFNGNSEEIKKQYSRYFAREIRAYTRRNMAWILSIQRKTLGNQPFNPSINQSINQTSTFLVDEELEGRNDDLGVQ